MDWCRCLWVLTLDVVISRYWLLTFSRRAKNFDLDMSAGLIKDWILIGSPRMGAGRTVWNSIGSEFGEKPV